MPCIAMAHSTKYQNDCICLVSKDTPNCPENGDFKFWCATCQLITVPIYSPFLVYLKSLSLFLLWTLLKKLFTLRIQSPLSHMFLFPYLAREHSLFGKSQASYGAQIVICLAQEVSPPVSSACIPLIVSAVACLLSCN